MCFKMTHAKGVVKEREKHQAQTVVILAHDMGRSSAKVRYPSAARAKEMPLFAFVMGDFLKPTVVEVINAAGYHGHVGDCGHRSRAGSSLSGKLKFRQGVPVRP